MSAPPRSTPAPRQGAPPVRIRPAPAWAPVRIAGIRMRDCPYRTDGHAPERAAHSALQAAYRRSRTGARTAYTANRRDTAHAPGLRASVASTAGPSLEDAPRFRFRRRHRERIHHAPERRAGRINAPAPAPAAKAPKEAQAPRITPRRARDAPRHTRRRARSGCATPRLRRRRGGRGRSRRCAPGYRLGATSRRRIRSAGA